MEQIGLLALPNQYERELRFVNLYRQHDVLRSLSDEEYDRFILYMESSSNIVLDVMLREKDANTPIPQKKAKKQTQKPVKKRVQRKTKASAKKNPVVRKKTL